MSYDADEIRSLQAEAFEQGARAMARVCKRTLVRLAAQECDQPTARRLHDVADSIQRMLDDPSFSDGNPYVTGTPTDPQGTN